MSRFRIVPATDITPKPKPTHAIQLGHDEPVALVLDGTDHGAHLLVDAANAFLDERDSDTGLHARMRQLEAERAKYLEEIARLRAALGSGGPHGSV